MVPKLPLPLVDVRIANSADERSAISTLVLAFAVDPPTRWMWPDSATYLHCMPRLLKAVAGSVFAVKSGHILAQSRGIALWISPKPPPMDRDAVVRLIEETIPLQRQEKFWSHMEDQTAYALEEPHWQLPFIGVDPTWQGKGLGSALLRAGLERCDEDGQRASLAASTPANVRLYKRFGFEIVGESMLGDEIPITHMVRDPVRR